MRKNVGIYIIIILLTSSIVLFIWSFSLNKNGTNPWYFEKIGVDIASNDSNIVAIIDSGYNQEGFDEGNIVYKYNTIDDNNNVNDNYGHGSAMLALLIGYKYDDISVVGLNKNAKVMIIKAVSDDGKSKPLDVAEGIILAVDNGANIINLSLGSRISNNIIYEAIKYAKDNDVIITAAIGDMESENALYPANYDEVIGVGAQAKDGTKYVLSNEKTSGYILCPGVEIRTINYNYLTNNIELTEESGSSVATVIFSGLLSLCDIKNKDINYDYLYDKCNKNEFIKLGGIVK